ncbi:MAG: hypothetical protein Q9164_004121 [Protoblastenia rupestris]
MAPSNTTASFQDQDSSISIPEQAHPETLLWARRLQLEHRKIHSLISTNHNSINTRINELTEQTKNIAASSEHQHNDTTALQQRVNDLEHEPKARGRSIEANLLEQLQATIAAQQKEIQMLADSQQREIRTLADIFIVWRNEWSAQGRMMKEEIARLRGECGGLAASKGLIQGDAVGVPLGSPACSEATTMDDTSPVRQIPETPSNHPRIRDRSLEPAQCPSSSRLAAQGTSSLEEYLRYGGSTIPECLELYEAEMIKNFVNGLSDKAHRSMLWEHLDVAGWTWANVEELIGKMITNGVRRLRGGKVRQTL